MMLSRSLLTANEDPYYFLYFDQERTAGDSNDDPLKSFVRSLPPSFLSMDVDGRVVRLDR
jgi:aromatic amino acid aminotransferase I